MYINNNKLLESMNTMKDFYKIVNDKKFKLFVLEYYKNDLNWYKYNNLGTWEPSETTLDFYENKNNEIDLSIDFNFSQYQGCNEYISKEIELSLSKVLNLINEYKKMENKNEK